MPTTFSKGNHFTNSPDEARSVSSAISTGTYRRVCSASIRMRDFGEVGAQDRRLGASQIILGELADRLEQAAALLVVEVFRRDALLGAREAREHFLQKIVPGRKKVVEAHHPWRGGLRGGLGFHAVGGIRKLARLSARFLVRRDVAPCRRAGREAVWAGAAGGELQPLTYSGSVADTRVFTPGIEQHDDNRTPGKRHLHDQAPP